MTNLLAIVASFVYIFAVLGVAEGLRRALRLPTDFTRKVVLFFDLSPTLMAILLMPLTWGDPFAAILGRRFGRHRYRVFGSTRSVEGSLAMFLFAFFGVFVPSLFVSSSVPAFNLLLAFALAFTATAAEAVSPRGLDNVLIPASSALTFAVLWPLALGRMVI